MRKRYAIASTIDSAASGLWPPFVLLFLVHAQHLPPVRAGAGLTVGGLLGLASGPLVGMLLDRIGPVTLVIASNVVRAAGFLYYPHVDTVTSAAVVAVVLSVGDRLFWTANAPMGRALAVGDRDVERLLGRQSIGRFAGAGVGAGITAVMPNIDSPVLYNVVNYSVGGVLVVCAVLLLGIRVPHIRVGADARWSVVFRDRRYVAMCATQVLFCLSSVAKYTVLPIVVIDVLHGPQWVSGLAMIIGMAVYVVIQEPVLRIAARHSRSRGMVLGAGLFAIAFAAMALATVFALPVTLTVIVVACAVMSLGETIFSPLSTAAAVDAAPAGAQGRASALFQLAWGLAVAVGPGLLTSLLTLGPTVLWLVLAVVATSAIPAVRATQRRAVATSAAVRTT
ncbi:MFS transporter [Kibdelosporangium lantanae]